MIWHCSSCRSGRKCSHVAKDRIDVESLYSTMQINYAMQSNDSMYSNESGVLAIYAHSIAGEVVDSLCHQLASNNIIA